jgi:hypothetical protein
MKIRNWLQTAVALGALLGFVNGVRANSITLGSVSGVGGGPSTWTYDYTFANSTLAVGDFFTINDFGSAAVGSGPAVPAGWVFSQALVGPNSLPAVDNPTVLNATFTFTGAPGPVADGTFSFSLISPLGAAFQFHDYTSSDHSTSDGSVSRVIGQVRGPVTVVPDGGLTIAFLGFALTGIGLLRRKLS